MNRESKTDRARIVDAEIALTHLQQDYESLNEVVLQQQQSIEQLTQQVKRLESRIDQANDPEIRDAETEKPPHY